MAFKNKADALAYTKEYRSRPEVKEHRRLQQQEYRRKWREAHKSELKSYYEKWNAENADKIKQYQLSYRKRRRYAVIQLLGGRCVRCGFDDFRALQIDHIHGGGRKEERELGSNAAIHKKILGMERPETEYQCLCANCNWIKREEDKECEK